MSIDKFMLQQRGSAAGPILLAAAAGLAIWGIVQASRNGNGGGNGVAFLNNPTLVARVGNGATATVNVGNPTNAPLPYALVSALINDQGQPISVPPAKFGTLQPVQTLTETVQFVFGVPSPIVSGRNYTVHFQLFRQGTSEKLDELAFTVGASMSQGSPSGSTHPLLAARY